MSIAVAAELDRGRDQRARDARIGDDDGVGTETASRSAAAPPPDPLAEDRPFRLRPGESALERAAPAQHRGAAPARAEAVAEVEIEVWMPPTSSGRKPQRIANSTRSLSVRCGVAGASHTAARQLREPQHAARVPLEQPEEAARDALEGRAPARRRAVAHGGETAMVRVVRHQRSSAASQTAVGRIERQHDAARPDGVREVAARARQHRHGRSTAASVTTRHQVSS
jgi:hypothetical protein